MIKKTLGIDIGSTSFKLCVLSSSPGAEPLAESHAILSHDGDIEGTLERLLDTLGFEDTDEVVGLVTGNEGRHRIALPDVIAAVAIESALDALQLRPRAVVSMGGEDLVVYVLDGRGRIINTYAGNKCASGTGEFFRQQLGRMNLELDDINDICRHACVHPISARCSVFMKSDCTHRLNKGEATKADVALSLSKVMADKVGEFLIKAKLAQGQVVLIGGVTRNEHLIEFIGKSNPSIELIVPEQAAYFEAFGAAYLARLKGAKVPARDALVRPGVALAYKTFSPLSEASSLVFHAPSRRAAYDPDAEYILGVDGGSTTTKVALVNALTLEIVAEHYGRTHGDPVAALKQCLREVRRQLGDHKPRIRLVATTGSSRELLGVFLETVGVYNEIIAHTVGTTFFQKDVDTIFEIGGQDAKYVLINNGVPIDYAMNEACSAGTGSFLEESAAGDLNIHSASEIGPIALRAAAPLKFGEHCSAFINSDIRKAIQQGAPREDIVAGLVFSIVANYLNRVVGNRSVGSHIVLQGGVAKNPAVPLAFAQMTGKSITVPPDPELMGCFGVARLVLQKHDEGLVDKGEFDIDALIDKPIAYGKDFVCKSCDNLCTVRRLVVGARRYPFGGRCSLYTNQRKKRTIHEEKVVDYTQIRTRMLFEDFAPKPDSLRLRTTRVVGVPMAFTVHSLWPFYSWFFHTLGVRIVTSTRIVPEGIAKQESNYCFPTEIAHGAIQDVLNQGVDFIFLPHFRDMPSTEDVHACVCPLTQGLPYFARQAFGLADEMVLRPVLSLKDGFEASRGAFENVAVQLGFTREEGSRAYDKGIEEYRRFLDAYRTLGKEVLREVQSNPDRVFIALLGRPYNAFTRDANMGIPRKFTSQGVTILPFDMIYSEEGEIPPNNYWYYGQQNMRAVQQVKRVENLYLAWISNFSCAPDSFLLHYVRWMMGQKPYLVLEIDSHTADAGLDTRIEAFLDIVESYRRHVTPDDEKPFERRYSIAIKQEYCDVVDRKTGKRYDIRDPNVHLVWPSMGDLSTEAMDVVARRQGILSTHLPLPDVYSTQLARNVASGKECIPALLVLGSVLKFFQEHPPNQDDGIYVVFVPSTLGPCRTGQYHVFFDRLFEEMGWENVVLLVANSENSYREMGATFNQDVWRALVLGDTFTDIRTSLRLLAKDPIDAMVVFSAVWRDVMKALLAGPKQLDRELKRSAERLARIPRKAELQDLPKVLIVGEIYVRRDNFSVDEVSEMLMAKGIYPKVTGVTEWFHYTDYARKFIMEGERKKKGWLRTLRDGGVKDEAVYLVEKVWKEHVESKMLDVLRPTGLVPDVPHDMDEIIGKGREHFVDPEMESEATVSPAVGAAAMQEGYSGVAIIAPFGCLPGRLIEGVYAPWAKARGYPVLALENDGQPYPPNIVSRIEVFAHHVKRFNATEPSPKKPSWRVLAEQVQRLTNWN
ncbi:MAG TPA: acyl-CoA dehydratase activase [Polyangiaceae bacterium]|jgi:predicted CoA-substrate-specific enzyme activase|nr:MAG: R-phenyllactate dehydratase activator [Deltaproteobacteria bacterium ADurb.Bin207]HNZ24243.1 acyl-CoA dehydratase activase [Polyangiaceae bacterium]HOD22878.1 acyl-CoA dehydratase activase [Polyangiaceae bacterium]HOE50471.1 acyl-CoA dehydratase activase [Polyangiaceae bacterium]HOH02304.1 acyl-CoA dehydratase activase [Polyangiaceae bacterium]